MKRTVVALLMALGFVPGLTSTVRGQLERAETALRAAIETETVKGDLKAAIVQYQTIVDQYKENRPVAAQALLRLAECHQRLGSAAAAVYYTRILREFSDQADVAAVAASRMASTSRHDPKRRMSQRSVWAVAEGGDIYGKVSPNGRFVPFTDWSKGGDLFVHDVSTGANRRLTDTGNDGSVNIAAAEYAEEAAFSRDSRQLAYAWGKDRRYQLRVIRLDDVGVPQPRVLVDNPEIEWIWPEDWTPDGRMIAVGLKRKDGTSQMGLVSTTDGSVRVLKSMEWRGYIRMAVSPDGRHLAVNLRGADTNAHDIFILAMDGSREVTAVAHRADDVLLGWSPDGQRLLFTSDRTGSVGVWSAAFARGQVAATPDLLKADVGSIAPIGLTASGALFMTTWASRTGEIKVGAFDFATGQFTGPLTELSGDLGMDSFDQPRWSPDGKSLAYVVRPRAGLRSRVTLVVRSMETGSTRHLTPSLAQFNPIWAPGGDGFYAIGTDFKGRSGIYRIDQQTGDVAPFVLARSGDQVMLPIFSEDGERSYYRRVTQATGESILIEREVRSGVEREVARGERVGLSTARKKVYFRPSDATGSIVERDLVSGAERTVFHDENIRNFIGTFQIPGTFGDSGSFIAVVAREGGKRIVWLLVPLGAGKPRELLQALAPERLSLFTVSPDRRDVYIRKDNTSGADPETSELWRVPLGVGDPQQIVWNEVRVNSIALPPGSFAVHPDGSRVAVIIRPRVSVPYEVWTLENFLPSQTSQSSGRKPTH